MTRRHSALVLSLLALLLTLPALRSSRTVLTPQQQAYQQPLNQFVARLCPGSEVQVLSTHPLRLVGTINAGPRRRLEVDTSLHNLLGPEAQILVLPGRAPWRPDPYLLWAGVALLAAFPAWQLLQTATRKIRAKVRPHRSWAVVPAALGAGVLCFGWPLWLLLPGLIALLVAMRRQVPKRGDLLREAAIYLSSRPNEFKDACLQLFKPDQMHRLLRAMTALDSVKTSERARVLTAFSSEVAYTHRLLGLKLSSRDVDPALAVRILTDKYLTPTTPPAPRPSGFAPVNSRGRRKIYSCPTCDEVFIDLDSLEKHQLFHRPVKRRTFRRKIAAGLVVAAAFTATAFLTQREVRQLALPGSQPLTVPQVQALSEAERIQPHSNLLIVRGKGGAILAATNSDLRRVQPLLGMPAIALPRSLGWLWLVAAQLSLAAGLLLSTRPPRAVPVPAPEPVAPPETPRASGLEDLTIELGSDLAQLADPGRSSHLRARLGALRGHLTKELGLPLGPVRICHEFGLPKSEYRLLLRNEEVGRGKLWMNRFLAIGPEEKLQSLPGDLVPDPTHGLNGKWISPERRGDAERLGCMIFDTASVLANHLTEIARGKAHLLLPLDQLAPLLEHERYQPLLDELAARQVDRIVIWRILRLLLQERVCIRDLLTILEALLQNVHLTQEPDLLCEFARGALAGQICASHANDQKTLLVLCLEPQLEFRFQGDEDPVRNDSFRDSMAAQIRMAEERGLRPILLCSPDCRLYLYRHLRLSHPDLVVLSWNDIAPDYNVNCIGLVTG